MARYMALFPLETHWQTKDGDFLKISEMTDSHLLAIIRFQYKNGYDRSSYIWKEVCKRGLIFNPSEEEMTKRKSVLLQREGHESYLKEQRLIKQRQIELGLIPKPKRSAPYYRDNDSFENYYEWEIGDPYH